MNIKIMFIDHEKLIIRSLKKLLKEKPYTCIFFTSGKSALEYLENNHIDIVVSDVRMIDIDSIELLNIIKDKYPKIIRIAMSEFTDKFRIKKMLSNNLARIHIFKPWNDKDLNVLLDLIVRMEETLMNNEILDGISKMKHLPSIPEIYNELNKMIKNDESIENITKIIEQDQSFASKVLKTANLAFYGKKTGTISQAVLVIGLNNLKNIILTNTVFNESNVDIKIIKELWKHSALTNNLTHLIYEEFFKKSVPLIFSSAALLHDVGKVILHMNYSKSYEKLIKKSKQENISIVKLEREHYGVTHQEIGAFLLNWWELPYGFIEVALLHHKPCDDRIITGELLKVVHLADIYATKILTKIDCIETKDIRVLASLNIDKEELEKVIDDFVKKV